MKRYICDGIVKGATHVRNQMPCQDNKKIVEISDQIAIVAVADGHGSSKCPRSDRGSQIAVNSFYEVMKNYLKIYGEYEGGLSNLITFLNREGDMRFAQDVCEEWQARVCKHIMNRRLIFRNQMKKWRKWMQRDLMQGLLRL